MALNLRLTEEQDRALSELAEVEHVSKNEAAIRAIMERAATLAHDAEVKRYAREAIARYGTVLDRLAAR